MGGPQRFQPGEEGYAGGRVMIDEGVLDAAGRRPVAAYALHVDSAAPARRIVTREGSMMASASALRVVVRGTGGHAAYPQLAVDPVPVAAQIILILAVQTFAARRLRPPTRPSSHSEHTRFDDSVVSLQAEVLAELAWRRLQKDVTAGS